jgi:hypothetical protein
LLEEEMRGPHDGYSPSEWLGQIPATARQIRWRLLWVIPRELVHGTEYSHPRGARGPENDYPSALAMFEAKHSKKHPNQFDGHAPHISGGHPAEPIHLAISAHIICLSDREFAIS